MVNEWDKVFERSESVNHEKVTFTNHFGIKLVADLYTPKNIEGKLPALAVAGPFGAVKEQSSGLYAQTMAEKGYVALAFDPSFTGESGGEARDVFSLDINTEDYQAAVDYLSNLSYVDAEEIGLIGICGWGGIALNAAAMDPRIKATAAVTMYDMARIGARGYFDQGTDDDRYDMKKSIAQQRTEEYGKAVLAKAGGCVEYPAPADLPEFVQQYSAYYKTKRGYHKRSVNSNEGWVLQSQTGWANTQILTHPQDLRNAVLIVHGEKAHSRYMGEETYQKLVDAFEQGSEEAKNKELIIVEGATHTDLYDGGDNNYIPFDKIDDFFARNLRK
ncbi:alpha/beta hydrolase [Alloscardovia theropitheci]|uniref:Alpha/beta hydrolase n=1 Tax=Alloscardovia theropitheci TaxID=2496842 RepID=A0A4V2MTW0_9BIFI|nr:alpha/beta hydrolase [Alloscardovia theropitheci]TCD53979.1 alpha/beta hydrolase [Alloscardovia theropitheci]